jgi:hypothetical protein
MGAFGWFVLLWALVLLTCGIVLLISTLSKPSDEFDTIWSEMSAYSQNYFNNNIDDLKSSYN